MSKKILIINSRGHELPGGMETYSRNLINALIQGGHHVYELNLMPVKCAKFDRENYSYVNHDFGKEKNYNLPNLIKNVKLLRLFCKVARLANKIIQKENINIVIENNLTSMLSLRKNVVYIGVQHFDWFVAKNNKILYFLKKMRLIKNEFRFPNIVVYSYKDIEYLQKYNLVKPNSNIFSINLASPHTHTHTHTQGI